jgi:hypothetical protein
MFGVTALLQSRLSGDVVSELADRQYLWAVGWQRFLLEPLVGGGVASNADLFSSVGLTYYVHNAPIEWLSRLGFFLGTITYLYVLAPKTLLSRSTMSSAMAFAFIVGLFEPSIETFAIGTLVVVVATAIMHIDSLRGPEHHDSSGQGAVSHHRGVPLRPH